MTAVAGSTLGFTAPSNHKNQSEEVRVGLSEYNGHTLVSVRVFYERDGDMLPGKQGISMRVAAIPDLIERLRLCEQEALRLGLISREGAR
jgi:hypothetical protein